MKGNDAAFPSCFATGSSFDGAGLSPVCSLVHMSLPLKMPVIGNVAAFSYFSVTFSSLGGAIRLLKNP